MDDLYCSEECKVLHESVIRRVGALERAVSDHAQRFDTLQTPFWKRALFWLDGWPWHDLNADLRAWRPWHGTPRLTIDWTRPVMG